jgi:hypothetical protein
MGFPISSWLEALEAWTPGTVRTAWHQKTPSWVSAAELAAGWHGEMRTFDQMSSGLMVVDSRGKLSFQRNRHDFTT